MGAVAGSADSTPPLPPFLFRCPSPSSTPSSSSSSSSPPPSWAAVASTTPVVSASSAAEPPRASPPPPFALAVVAGGFASATVDITVYPLDTLKTRMQAPRGLNRSGGFRRLFAGVGPTALGSVPGGAIFFGVYERSKLVLSGSAEPPSFNGASHTSSAHWSCDAAAAVVAATASCFVRTPTAVVAQRMQIGQYRTVTAAVRGVARGDAAAGTGAVRGGIAAFYTGLGVSVARELPFAFVQFPLYEALKRCVVRRNATEGNPSVRFSAMEGAACGSLAGAAAAAVTTPFDVVKTRLMVGANAGAWTALRQVIGEGALFSGMGPRVGWMAIGGFIFFGVYERCLQLLQAIGPPASRRRNAETAAAEPLAERLLAHQAVLCRDGDGLSSPAPRASRQMPPPETAADQTIESRMELEGARGRPSKRSLAPEARTAAAPARERRDDGELPAQRPLAEVEGTGPAVPSLAMEAATAPLAVVAAATIATASALASSTEHTQTLSRASPDGPSDSPGGPSDSPQDLRDNLTNGTVGGAIAALSNTRHARNDECVVGETPPLTMSDRHASPSDEVAVRSIDTLLAGGLAGMATDAILHPVDTVKTRIINGRPLFSPSLWSGLSVAIMPAIPAAATFFTVYESAKRSAARTLDADPASPVPCIFAAAVAESFSCVVRVPFEQLKMRMQANRHVSLSTLFKTRGVRGAFRQLYRGLPATLALDLPFALIQLPTFEALKLAIARERSRRLDSGATTDSVSIADDALAGAAAGGLAAALTTPLDVIRTRHVLRAGGVPQGSDTATPECIRSTSRPSVVRHKGGTEPISSATRSAQSLGASRVVSTCVDTSFVGTARLVFHAEGARGLLRGILPRTLYMAMGGILYLGTYSIAARRLGESSERAPAQ